MNSTVERDDLPISFLTNVQKLMSNPRYIEVTYDEQYECDRLLYRGLSIDGALKALNDHIHDDTYQLGVWIHHHPDENYIRASYAFGDICIFVGVLQP